MKTNYKVEPEEPNLLTEPIRLSWSDKAEIFGERSGEFFAGLIIGFIGAVILGVVLYTYTDWISFYNWSITFLVISLVWFSYNIFKVAKQIEEEPYRRQDAANEKERKRVVDKAENLTNRANGYYSNLLKLAGEMQEHLEKASRWLQKAEFEYEEDAPNPYWTAIENALDNLNQYRQKANKMDSNLNDYFNILNGRNHNFPLFIILPETVEEAKNVKNEYSRIQRKGEKTKNEKGEDKGSFPVCFGLIKINKTLVDGFQTLEDAVNNVGNRFESSLFKLEKTINTGFTNSLEAENETRKKLEQSTLLQNQLLSEQSRILDKTQKLIDRSSKE